MSADKDPIRSAHETLALIADKLSIERSGNSNLAPPPEQSAAPSPPPPAVPSVAEVPSAPTAAVPAIPPTPAVEAKAPPPPPEPPPPAPPPVAVPPPEAVKAAEPAPPPPQPKPEEAARAVPPVAIPLSLQKGKERSPFSEAMLTYFPMLIAVMAIGMSIYQGYLFNQSIDAMYRTGARSEYIRTCRESIDSYFQVKLKVGTLMPAADKGNIFGASRVYEVNRLEAQAAAAKFAGLVTYLTNFQDAGTRARYTELTKTLNGILENARNVQLADIDKLFAPAEKLFSQMNDDCARLARAMKM